MDRRYYLTRQEIISLSLKTTFYYFVFLFLVASIPVIKIWASQPKYPELKYEAYIVIEDKTVHIEKVDTPDEMARGLSDFQSLNNNEGMFFVFGRSDLQGIWMKDMNFSIDVIWFDKNYKVVDYVENLSPETYPHVFFPKQKALYALEVPAGFVKNNKVLINDQATIFQK